MSNEVAQQFGGNDDDNDKANDNDVIVTKIELRNCSNQFDGLKMRSLIFKIHTRQFKFP